MTTEQAIQVLRADPRWSEHMRDSYLDADPRQAALRFSRSAEFAEVLRFVGGHAGARVLDLGAGTGIASLAFAFAGAREVVALEPDPSDIVGQQAIRISCADAPAVEIVSGFGEALPFRDESFDVVYARQVLHHARDLPALVQECARVLRAGGKFVACREHVVDDEAQLREFLAGHPVHQLAGGEHAWSLAAYQSALVGAGLATRALGPWDTVVNAYPFVTSEEERRGFARSTIIRRLGVVGRLVSILPGAEALAWGRIDRRSPGRLFTFVCEKPGPGMSGR